MKKRINSNYRQSESEVFVLLKGEATLFIGKERIPVKMEPCKIYNVTVGIWHNIVCSEDASVLIAENSDTNKSNKEYHLRSGYIY